MTKKEYIELRNQPEIPLDIWFEYYQERGGTLDKEEFIQIFSILMTQETVTATKVINFHTALNNFYRYYNQKFGL